MGGLNGFRESIWLQSSFPFEGPSKTLIFREQRGILVSTIGSKCLRLRLIQIHHGKNARCMKRFGEGVGANPILHGWVRIKKSYDQHLKKAKNPWLYHSPEEHGLRFLDCGFCLVGRGEGTNCPPKHGAWTREKYLVAIRPRIESHRKCKTFGWDLILQINPGPVLKGGVGKGFLWRE